MTIQTNLEMSGKVTHVIPVTLRTQKTLEDGSTYQEFIGEDRTILSRIPEVDGEDYVVLRSVLGHQWCSGQPIVALYVTSRDNTNQPDMPGNEESKYFV